MSTKDCKTKQNTFDEGIKKIKEKHPIRWKWYILIAKTRIKVGVSLYKIAKFVGKWHDEQDYYGEHFADQVQRKIKNEAIYCPITKCWIRRADCPPCEMCPD